MSSNTYPPKDPFEGMTKPERRRAERAMAKDQKKAMSHFRGAIMPALSKMNVCWYADGDTNTIHINPRLK